MTAFGSFRSLTMQLLIAALAVAIVILAPARIVSAGNDFLDLLNLTERSEGYYTMISRTDGKVIMRTARVLHVGDQFINSENRHFRVVEIEQDVAWAEILDQPAEAEAAVPAGKKVPVQGDGPKGPVAIYHSHGAESYVPSDGTESIDQGGGILQVGEEFSQSLEQDGIETVHATETHVPHDAGAYQRSRRTAEELLQLQPAAMFDVHRDAVPPDEYDAEVKGEDVVRILMVVGRQNPNMAANQEFARGLKQVADEQSPGLVKGILLADGSYNQDLMPRSVLLEVGAHENRREQAEEAVSLFADAVDSYLAGEAAAPDADSNAASGASRALMLLAALIIGAFVYLLISAGSWEEFKQKASAFFNREFADLRGGLKRNRRDDDEQH